MNSTAQDAGPGTLFLPCAAGAEAWLAEEVARLLPGATPDVRRGGVSVFGGPREAMALNLGSRIAQRVLVEVMHGPYRHEDDLYALAREVDWSHWIGPRETLRVDVTATRSPLQSLNFAGLRIKDAVCDQIREREGARPSVELRHADLPLVLHVGEAEATIYVDTSGEALFKRGWREDKGEAPLKETLAAAMLAAAGWQGREEDGPLLDPVCGSGTIAIEAAQIACGIAPGLLRRFAFERQRPFLDGGVRRDWQDLADGARAAVHAPRVAIHAGDVSFRMTDFATRNAERAGVLTAAIKAIEFKTADALQRTPPAERGTLMLNPPYGERIEPKGTGRGPRVHRVGSEPHTAAAREGFEGGADAAEFASQLAAHWKRQYAGWTAWILSPDAKLPQAMRLKESRRIPMWNGPIECRLFRFDMVAGSAR